MAYRRSICSRATLFARRFNPSFTYISHDRDDSNKRNDEGGCRKINDLLAQRRCFGTYMGNNSGPGNVFHNQRAILGGIGNGVGSHRFMSTSIGEGVDKVGYLSDAAGAITDVSTEVIASQAPVLSEVAIAAADSAFPVAALQYVIDSVHSFTGLGWAASIALTTVLIRGASVPLLINQLKSTSKLAMMKPYLEEVKQEMEEKANDPAAIQEGRQKMNALFKEYGVTPFTPLKGIFFQAPIFISFFLAISNMAEKVPSFKTGGALWFTDLTTPDAMYIFPVLTALTFLMTVEFNMQEGMEGNPIAGNMKMFSRALAVLTVPFTMSFPKAIFCYWITSNVFSFAYGFVIKRPGVKEALGIPKIPVSPPSTNQGTQSGFSLFKAIKQAAASGNYPAIPATSGQSKSSTDVKTSSLSSSSSTAVLNQRIKSLEIKVKKRKKNKKRKY
ncbi:mitochondrial inner membrane protein OXA1-like isoform X2 [Silene latifolia]|uniref:mitochondrial inner membrane protein OXA1-like isoform X2 n=1 Tax=Silene latifolia TaxID=37657 RepID=UPI003D7876A4